VDIGKFCFSAGGRYTGGVLWKRRFSILGEQKGSALPLGKGHEDWEHSLHLAKKKTREGEDAQIKRLSICPGVAHSMDRLPRGLLSG